MGAQLNFSCWASFVFKLNLNFEVEHRLLVEYAHFFKLHNIFIQADPNA